MTEEWLVNTDPGFCKIEGDTTSDWLNQKLCYSQMLLNTEKSGEQDLDRSENGW